MNRAVSFKPFSLPLFFSACRHFHARNVVTAASWQEESPSSAPSSSSAAASSSELLTDVSPIPSGKYRRGNGNGDGENDEMRLLQRFADQESQSKYVKKGLHRDEHSGEKKARGAASTTMGSEAGDDEKAVNIGWFPESRIALLPNTTGRYAEQLRLDVMDHAVVAQVRSALAAGAQEQNTSSSSGIAILGQTPSGEKGMISRLANAFMINLRRNQQQKHQRQHQQQQQQPTMMSALVVSRSLDSLLPLAQSIPQPVRSSFVFVRSVDPFFALLHCCPDRHLRRAVVNFPPPCPSDRESYRRIVHARFLALVHQKLALGGDFVVATDYAPLHKFHAQELVKSEASSVSWVAAKHMKITAPSTASGSKVKASETKAEEDEIDVATMPCLEDAPAHVRFALEAGGAGSGSNRIHFLRRFKDSDTSEVAIAANASFVLERSNCKFGALVK